MVTTDLSTMIVGNYIILNLFLLFLFYIFYILLPVSLIGFEVLFMVGLYFYGVFEISLTSNFLKSRFSFYFSF